MESFRWLLPFLVALAAAAAIEFRAMQAPLLTPHPLLTHLLVGSLLLLVQLRQQVISLDQLRVRRIQEEARASALALRESTRHMETFLGMASHELKAPMTSLIVGLQLLQHRLQRLMSSLAGAAGDASQQVEALQALDHTLLQ